MGQVADDAELFWQGVASGKLLLTRCAKCSRLQHPPSPMCPNCGSLEWDGLEASGRGTVHSWILARHPGGRDDDPRIVALIDLDEGVRLVSNLVDVAVGDVKNDMAVEVTFADVDGMTLPRFRPARREEVVRTS
jgi:uncharacterized OB-fold protein